MHLSRQFLNLLRVWLADSLLFAIHSRDSIQLGGSMKRAVTFRIHADLLVAAKERAVGENRSLTNFVETILRDYIFSETRGQRSLPLKGSTFSMPKMRKAART